MFIYSAKTCLRGKTPSRLSYLGPGSGRRRIYRTIFELADHAPLKMVRYVLLRTLRPELDGQDVEASSSEDTPSLSR
jgi:hypothetical protein